MGLTDGFNRWVCGVNPCKSYTSSKIHVNPTLLPSSPISHTQNLAVQILLDIHQIPHPLRIKLVNSSALLPDVFCSSMTASSVGMSIWKLSMNFSRRGERRFKSGLTNLMISSPVRANEFKTKNGSHNGSISGPVLLLRWRCPRSHRLSCRDLETTWSQEPSPRRSGLGST